MKRLLAVLLLILLFPHVASAQEVQKMTLDEYLKNIRLTKTSEEKFDFRVGTRLLREFVLVKVPPGALRVNFTYMLLQEEGVSYYLVSVEGPRFAQIEMVSGEKKAHEIKLRIIFMCSEHSQEACRTKISEMFRIGLEMQSKGVLSLIPRSDILPNERLIFGFDVGQGGFTEGK